MKIWNFNSSHRAPHPVNTYLIYLTFFDSVSQPTILFMHLRFLVLDYADNGLTGIKFIFIYQSILGYI